MSRPKAMSRPDLVLTEKGLWLGLRLTGAVQWLGSRIRDERMVAGPGSGQTARSGRPGRLVVPALVLGTAVLLSALMLVGYLDHVDLLKGVDLGNEQSTTGEPIPGVGDAITTLQTPANVTVVSLSGLGIAAGGAMLAVGSQKGLKILGASAGALAALGLGNGIVE